MKTFQLRIPVQVRDKDDPRRPKDWHDDYVRVDVRADNHDGAVALLASAIERIANREFEAQMVDEGI